MVISVIIGLVQVLLGMVLKGCKAWKNFGFAYAIGTFSWVIALLAAIILFGLPACGITLSQGLIYALYGIIALSVVGIFLYNNPSAYKNPILGPLLNIGGGVWETYGMATGLLGDLLSYIRLFALGLAGGMLAQNQAFADINSGTGMMVIGLASVILGEVVFGTNTLLRRLIAASMGAILYRIIISQALYIGMESSDLKLVSAIIVAMALYLGLLGERGAKIRKKRGKNEKAASNS